MIKSNLEECLKTVISDNSEEYSVIIDTYDLLMSTTPVIASEAKTHLLMLDRFKVQLSTIYYLLTNQISSLKSTMQDTHDSMYVQLVKRGRPSKEAIETEIRALNPEYSGVVQQLDDYSEVKEYINMLLRSIDSRKVTTLEILRTINRID